jgi:glycosyltransferase involved in cell wall biosynthesis
VRLQRDMGIESELVFGISTSLLKEPFSKPLITAAALLDNLLRATNPVTLFSFYRDRVALFRLRKLTGVDILHLHWTPGMINIKKLAVALSRFPDLRVVWTLHDMFPITGGCHHALGCTSFEESCSDCPQIRPALRGKVQLSLSKKAAFMNEVSTISVVSPSSWLARSAMLSRVFRNKNVLVIPNPLRAEFTETFHTRKSAREAIGFSLDDTVVLFVAENLADPNKNIQSVVNDLPKNLSDGTRIHLLFVGLNGHQIDSNGKLATWLGVLSAQELADLLPAADLLIAPSTAENSPSVIWEAAASGVPSLASSTDPGGRELVEFMGFGLTIDDRHLLADKVLQLKEIRRSIGNDLSRRARERGSGVHVANQYLELYSRALM